MKLFFRFVLCYLALSLLIVALIRRQGITLLIEAASETYAFGSTMASILLLTIPLILALPFVLGWRRFALNLYVL